MKLELKEVATCLDLPMNTIERWIRQGRIPIRKTGTRCIFKKAVLHKWAKKHDITFTPPTEHGEDFKENSSETLVTAFKRGGVHHHVPGSSVEEVIQAASCLFTALSEEEKVVLCGKLLEREKLTSTGIGKGVAIPHPRTPMPGESTLPVIATCFLKNKIDFGAIDDKPVTVMFVIVCPSVKSHLHLLSMLSFCVRDNFFVEFLNTTPSPDSFYDKIDEFEKRLEKGH